MKFYSLVPRLFIHFVIICTCKLSGSCVSTLFILSGMISPQSPHTHTHTHTHMYNSYALIFEDNRISRDMLLDLNKVTTILLMYSVLLCTNFYWLCFHIFQDILNDMGIKVMGDIISILKHAKQVHSQVRAKFDFFAVALSNVSTKLKVHNAY